MHKTCSSLGNLHVTAIIIVGSYAKCIERRKGRGGESPAWDFQGILWRQKTIGVGGCFDAKRREGRSGIYAKGRRRNKNNLRSKLPCLQRALEQEADLQS